jgi:hypothetical protein
LGAVRVHLTGRGVICGTRYTCRIPGLLVGHGGGTRVLSYEQLIGLPRGRKSNGTLRVSGLTWISRRVSPSGVYLSSRPQDSEYHKVFPFVFPYISFSVSWTPFCHPSRSTTDDAENLGWDKPTPVANERGPRGLQVVDVALLHFDDGVDELKNTEQNQH